MEFSTQVNDILSKVKELQRQSDENVSVSKDYGVANVLQNDELVDVDEMDFSNLETWLYKSDSAPSGTEPARWLRDSLRDALDRRILDTRTYTRPKKTARPSLEKFNERYTEALKSSDENLSREIRNIMDATVPITSGLVDATAPLYFDLSQPASCTIFDNIIMNAATDVESFQNMPPPSLVNSMCSSTFTNLMESSFFQNDPILKEICEFERSEVSLNSDCPEVSLKRALGHLSPKESNSDVSNITVIPNNLNTSYVVENNLDGTYKKNITKDISYDMSSSSNSDVQNNFDVPNGVKKGFEDGFDSDLTLNCPLEIGSSLNSSGTDIIYTSAKTGSPKPKDATFETHLENVDPNTTHTKTPSANTTLTLRPKETFRISSNVYGTYKKYPTDVRACGDPIDRANRTVCLDNKFNNDNDDNNDDDDDSEDLMSKTLILDVGANKIPETPKRRSASFTTNGSTDSLDQASTKSNSSAGSSRVLSMAEVDAIVEYQERSLQIMSTPKPTSSLSKLCETVSLDFSPITLQKEHVSDSDLSSSTEDYLTSRSTLSDQHIDKCSGPTLITRPHQQQPVRSMQNLRQIPQAQVPQHQHQQQQRLAFKALDRGSCSNLTTIRPALKGSYTSLKPSNRNLPVIAPLGGGSVRPGIDNTFRAPVPPPRKGSVAANLDATREVRHPKALPGCGITSAPASQVNVTQVISHRDLDVKAPVAPTRQRSAPITTDKPQPRLSGLPRPVTGIPRPASRIPGPTTSRTSVLHLAGDANSHRRSPH